jgi:hypothetical protein
VKKNPLRDIEERVGVTAAILHQQLLVLRVLREPVGQHRAGRASPDDDIIEVHLLHLRVRLFLWSGRNGLTGIRGIPSVGAQ